MVNCVPSTSIVLKPLMVIGAVTLLLPVLTAKVPPLSVIGSATVTLRRSKLAPPLTVVPEPEAEEPKALALVIAKVP